MKARLELFLISARRLLLFLFSVWLLLSGCPSFSLHPLYTDEDVVMEPALEGTWPRVPAGNEKLLFQKAGSAEYSLVIFCPETRVSQNYDVHLVRLGGQLFEEGQHAWVHLVRRLHGWDRR
jgi:hypothetical protein